MTTRPDLLELTPEALMALANAGFVKRAQKDLAAGHTPRLEQSDDGDITAHFEDGVRTHLAPGRTLRDADCSCASAGMCRHRVLLVLTYQHQHADASPAHAPSPAGAAAESASEAQTGATWSPAAFDDAALASSFAPSVLAQAQRLAAERPIVTLQPGQAGAPPLARLPMSTVRFFSRNALAHARCDCKQGSGCAHVVVAVWAFREAARLGRDGMAGAVEVPPRTSDSPAAVLPFESAAAQAARAELESLARTLWLDGSSQPPGNLAGRIEALRVQLEALGWRWMRDALDELDRLLHAHHARSSRFDAHRLLAVVTELWARLQAAGAAARTDQAATPAGGSPDPTHPVLHSSQILGLGVKGEVELDHLRLVSLGAVLWSDPESEGADLVLADPDTQTVSVLSREWSRADQTNTAVESLTGRRVAGFPLRQLAAGQIITKTARRRANGSIDIAANKRQTGVMPLSPTAWDELRAPLCQTRVRDLVAHLRSTPPDFVLPRQAANGATADAGGHLHVVSLSDADVVHHHWDAAAQMLHATLVAAPASDDLVEDDPLFLTLPHRAATPHAVDVLARALAGEWGPIRALAGTVRLHGGRAVMQPLALLTSQRGVILQVEPAAAQTLPLQAERHDPPELEALAADTLDMLTRWLRQGLRHRGSKVGNHTRTQVERLQQAGLRRSATLLSQVEAHLRGEARARLVPTLSTLVLILQAVVACAPAFRRTP
ncbi:MAG: hypothetical protein ACK4KV_22985 [Rhodocyclaceae bacterium]